MTTCYKCGMKKESRQIAAHVDGKGDVCLACCNKGKTFVKTFAKTFAPKDMPRQQGYAFARKVRITFGGKQMVFDSISAASAAVGAPTYLIRKAARGVSPTRPEFRGLQAEFISKGA